MIIRMNFGLTRNPIQGGGLIFKPADNAIFVSAGTKKHRVSKVAAGNNGVNLYEFMKITVINIHQSTVPRIGRTITVLPPRGRGRRRDLRDIKKDDKV